MQALTRKAIKGQVEFVLVLALLVFLPAWSLGFWQGWVYWLIFTACTTGITLYFLAKDPALVERRLKAGAAAEREPSQKRIQAAAGMAVCAIMVVPGLQYHVDPTSIPVVVVAAADLLLALSFWIIFLVFRENSHASGIIEVHADQTVISTGPYAVVRHPMYAGASLMFLATPLALGSTWALALTPVVVIVLAVRLLDEERFLSRNLPGYDAYRRKVRWRLVPRVW